MLTQSQCRQPRATAEPAGSQQQGQAGRRFSEAGKLLVCSPWLKSEALKDKPQLLQPHIQGLLPPRKIKESQVSAMAALAQSSPRAQSSQHGLSLLALLSSLCRSLLSKSATAARSPFCRNSRPQLRSSLHGLLPAMVHCIHQLQRPLPSRTPRQCSQAPRGLCSPSAWPTGLRACQHHR